VNRHIQERAPPALQLELLLDVLAMRADGLNAQVQPPADFSGR